MQPRPRSEPLRRAFAIAAAEIAVETARNEVRLEVGVTDERKFNELAAPFEAKQDAPWLRRRKDTSGGMPQILLK
jgi:hypothetical protein